MVEKLYKKLHKYAYFIRKIKNNYYIYSLKCWIMLLNTQTK